MPQGTIKDYDAGGRTGTLITDDRQEIHINAASMEGAGIRYLRVGQRVKFDVADESGKKVARGLRIVTMD